MTYSDLCIWCLSSNKIKKQLSISYICVFFFLLIEIIAYLSILITSSNEINSTTKVCGSPWINLLFILLSNVVLVSILHFSKPIQDFYCPCPVGYDVAVIVLNGFFRFWSFVLFMNNMFGQPDKNCYSDNNMKNIMIESMSVLFVAIAIVLGWLLVMWVNCCHSEQVEKMNTKQKKELDKTKSKLITMEKQLEETKNRLDETKSQLEETKNQLDNDQIAVAVDVGNDSLAKAVLAKEEAEK